MLRHPLGHAAKLGVQLSPVGEVALEGGLDADRDPLGGQLELAWIDPARAVAQDSADAAREEAPQIGVAERREGADRLDAGRGQPLLGFRPHSRQAANRERREKGGFRTCRDDGEAARLAAVRRDLRHHLRRGEPERAGEARRSLHSGLHRLSDLACLEEVGRNLADIEIALVQARALDGRDDAANRGPDRL